MSCVQGAYEEMGYWCTSNELCMKRQVVDLLGNGFTGEELDRDKPPIRVRDWFV